MKSRGVGRLVNHISSASKREEGDTGHEKRLTIGSTVKTLPGADYFHTTNPATGEVLAGSRLRRRKPKSTRR
ncbi:hypothetical protein LNP74_17305 [Klebsiella pneumoniae subsp. pneumoniae]|nr:hypothetical protein [Klebsiella pneumoniae subsp. pneumoniae]